ncbi:Cytochrome P450 [Canna indica]|uniref:Cytochrome P450 n=1 Tax=Canna indica TaxID=4628 RepID=A0AAQ3JZY0_9LILI|nr:Cytochrome P450 [Canna indica]
MFTLLIKPYLSARTHALLPSPILLRSLIQVIPSSSSLSLTIAVSFSSLPFVERFHLSPAPTMSPPELDVASLLLLIPRTALSPILAVALIAFSVLCFFPGGIVWAFSKAHVRSIPGPPGFVSALSGSAAHRVLAGLAHSLNAVDLMAFSVGFTRFVVSSHPDTAKEILNSSAFADRPIKESAYELLFHRAMGFAPFGEYWRNLRRISSTYLFSPRRIAAFGEHRRVVGEKMVADVRDLMAKHGVMEVKKVLHFGSLNNVMMSVFGKRYDFGRGEGLELEGLVKEGYELLGLFNWGDHFPLLGWLDLQGVRKRCRSLVKRVNAFVGSIIEEHKKGRTDGSLVDGKGDFVDVLLGLEKEEKLSDADMVAVLWEMIFRGTDTVAILLEWIMARMVLHPDIQSKAQCEIDAAVGRSRAVCDADIVNLPYLQAIVKEALRMHPPGPLLSWARLAVHDVHVGDHFIPAGTTAMVNMWSITHDESIWSESSEFKPERFVEEDVSILGSDLRLAPFGAGRRVCPGKAMGLAAVHLWLAQLLQCFEWVPAECGVDLAERLKMSLEMEKPLVCKAIARN